MMKVFSITPYTTKRDNRNSVSFKSMKPSMFNGIDYACVRKFKAPVEKFNTVADFQNWASECVQKLLNQKFTARQDATEVQRKAMVVEWSHYLMHDKTPVTPAASLLVLSAILKELKPDNDKIPPTLNKKALADSMADLNCILEKDKNTRFDFCKIYQRHISKVYSGDNYFTNNSSGWIIIPSKRNNEEKFEDNVNKLKQFSAPTWCTKSFNAEYYLSKGDFHIYIENGVTRLGMRFEKDIITEIQDEHNNNHIPLKFLDVLDEHIEKNSYALAANIKSRIADTHLKRGVVEDIYNGIGIKNIHDNNVYRIMEYLGYKPRFEPDGSISIANYSRLDIGNNITMSDIGFNENKLFEKISQIRGDAIFADTGVTNLSAVKKIGGNADFENSFVFSLGGLEQVDGYLNLANSLVNFAPKVKKVGKWLDCEYSTLEDLPSLEYVGENAYFCNSKLKKLDKLKYIGKFADFSNTEINELPSLEYIGNGCSSSNSMMHFNKFKH